MPKICEFHIGALPGYCLGCATVTSIIFNGTDLQGKGLRGENVPAKTTAEKVELLIERGLFKK